MFEKAKKVNLICARISSSQGKEGVEELRALYPHAFFWWDGLICGLGVMWSTRHGRYPRAIGFHAAYLETLGKGGEVVKNKASAGMLPSEFLPPEAAVFRVMEC